MRSVIILVAVMTTVEAVAITATKEWVQSVTNELTRLIESSAGGGRADSVGTDAMWMDATGCVWQATYGGDLPLPDGQYSGMYEYGQTPVGEDGWYISLFGAGGEFGVYYCIGPEDMIGGYFNRYVGTLDLEGFSVIRPMGGRILVGRVALTNDVPSTPGDIGAAPSSIVDTVNAWQTYWDGDDVRVTVTNYYGSVDIPHLYIEQKMPADDDHASPWFKTIWDEMTRWSRFLDAYADVTNNVALNLADRAWGVYDSSTGAYSPDGMLQISQDMIQIASGLAYQKTVTSSGELWVLTATEPMTIGGETTNGYFRITDGDGSPLFEIVKGDKRTVGATPGGIRVVGNEVQIDYMVSDNSSVEIRSTTDLVNGEWSQVSATWTGSSGAYTAHVAKPSGDCAFFRATYEIGGDTYIKHTAPAGFERVYIGGHTYRVTVETVNGKKLMVLTDD